MERVTWTISESELSNYYFQNVEFYQRKFHKALGDWADLQCKRLISSCPIHGQNITAHCTVSTHYVG